MGSRPLAKGISQNFGQRNQKAAAVSSVQKCNGDHVQDLLGRGQLTLCEENEPLLRCTFREATRDQGRTRMQADEAGGLWSCGSGDG